MQRSGRGRGNSNYEKEFAASLLKLEFGTRYRFLEGFHRDLAELGDMLFSEPRKGELSCEGNERYVFFVIRGAACHGFEAEDKFIVTEMAQAGDIIVEAVDKRRNRRKGMRLLLYGNGVVLRISVAAFYERMEDAVWRRLYVDLMEQQLEVQRSHQLRLAFVNAEYRYMDLVRRKPVAMELVPAKHIASYLGISPESFSRLKKRMQDNVKTRMSIP